MLNISTFTFNFDHVEDRILLVGNFNNGCERVDYWLTRKLVLRLLNASGELVKKTSSEVAQSPSSHQAELTQFHHDSAQQSLPVERENKQVDAQDARLLFRLDISHKGGQYKLSFFSVESSSTVEPTVADGVSTLNYQELHQILHLLHQGAQILEWGVSGELFAPVQPDSSYLLQ